MDPPPSPPEDLVVVGMMPRQYIAAGTTRLIFSTYFHANKGCIKCRLPNFSCTRVDIQLGLSPLSHADKTRQGEVSKNFIQLR